MLKFSLKNFTLTRYTLSLALLGALTFVTTPQTARANAILSTELPDLVEKVLPGVVNISTITVQRLQPNIYGMEDFFRFWGVPKEQPQTSLGSGFIISKDGYVLTNNHVVEHADEVIVTLVDKKSYKARIIGKDPKLDLALLRIRQKDGTVPSDLKPVPLADSDKVRIAEPVFAVGNPFGLQHTVTTGIISAKNRTIGLGPLDNFLQTDASINPGNSGGPLFNFKGEVIGINTSIYSRTGQSAGLGFSIPVNEAKSALEDMKRYGRVPRPWLGILGQTVTPRLQAYYDLPSDKGVFIVNLVNRGPADDAGLKQGDIIIGVGGNETSDNTNVERELYRKKPNEKVALKIKRGGKTLSIDVKLEELPKLENLPQGVL